MTGHTVQRTYPVDDWYADPYAILCTFRAAAAEEAAEHGHDIEDVTDVTAFLEASDGTPAREGASHVRLVATWPAPTCHYGCGATSDLRPYGPGGAMACFPPCITVTPEPKQAAEAAFDVLLDAAATFSPLRAAVIGDTIPGPQPLMPGDLGPDT